MPESSDKRLLARAFGRVITDEECRQVVGGYQTVNTGPPFTTGEPVYCKTDYKQDVVNDPPPEPGEPGGPDEEPPDYDPPLDGNDPPTLTPVLSV